MLKIRQSCDRLIFSMGIPLPGKDGLYIEHVEVGPCSFYIFQHKSFQRKPNLNFQFSDPHFISSCFLMENGHWCNLMFDMITVNVYFRFFCDIFIVHCNILSYIFVLYFLFSIWIWNQNSLHVLVSQEWFPRWSFDLRMSLPGIMPFIHLVITHVGIHCKPVMEENMINELGFMSLIKFLTLPLRLKINGL